MLPIFKDPRGKRIICKRYFRSPPRVPGAYHFLGFFQTFTPCSNSYSIHAVQFVDPATSLEEFEALLGHSIEYECM